MNDETTIINAHTMQLANEIQGIMSEMLSTFIKKNTDYGNSFDKSIDEWGLVSAMFRIGDKFNRATTLAKASTQHVNDESLEDTLLDMANYCIMTVRKLREMRD